MKTHYDAETDALYLRFTEAAVSDTEEVRPGIMLDFDAAGRIVAIEVLDASTHLADGVDLTRLPAAREERVKARRLADNTGSRGDRSKTCILKNRTAPRNTASPPPAAP